ncbi:alpha/beta hydrolase-fold protein [Streptomyces zhihengii]
MLPLIERHYGAGTARVAAGESQGGFGALSYAARHPGLFRAVAGYSGFVHPLRHPHAVRAGMTYLGLDWRALWGDPVAQRRVWEAHDPYHLARHLRGTRVHLSAGDGRPGRSTRRAPAPTRTSPASRTRPTPSPPM